MRKQGRGIESDHPYPNTRGEERKIGIGGSRSDGEDATRKGETKTREGGKTKRERASLWKT